MRRPPSRESPLIPRMRSSRPCVDAVWVRSEAGTNEPPELRTKSPCVARGLKVGLAGHFANQRNGEITELLEYLDSL